MDDDPVNRHETSFEAYYRGDIVRLTHFVMKLGASYEQGWDIAQETMKETLARWATIETAHAYTRRVAKTIYFGQAKAEAARRTLTEHHFTHWGNTTTSAMSFTDETAYVMRLLAGLPPRQRTVMALHYDGFSVMEIADITEQSESTVRSHLRHARTALKQKIAVRR